MGGATAMTTQPELDMAHLPSVLADTGKATP